MGRNVKELHPRLQEKISQLQVLCAKENLQLGIGECFRSAKEQDELYAQGRTKPGNRVTNARGSSYSSQHQWGIAFDFFKNVKGQEYSDNYFFTRVSQLAKSIGLAWGGDWHSPVDKPHLYLPDWGSTPTPLKNKYGNFDNFKKTWDKPSITPIKPSETSSAVLQWHATGTATCGGDKVNVRQSPNGVVLLQLSKGNRFEIDGQTSGKWTHIKVNKTIGYMSTQYVIPDKVDEKANPQSDKIILKEDGKWGADTTRRAQQIFGLPQDGVISNQLNVYKSICAGILSAEWSNVKKGGSQLVRAIQHWLGLPEDGYIGPEFIAGLQKKKGKRQDGVLSNPSQCIAAFQHWCNQQP